MNTSREITSQMRGNQLGYPVFVNGKNLYDYNADLINYNLVPVQITHDVFKRIGKYNYIINQYQNGNNGIDFSFYVGGENYTDAQLNVNRVIGEFQKNAPVVVTIGDSEFEYVCVLTNIVISYTNVLFYYKLDVSVIAVKRFSMVTLTYDSSEATQPITIDNIGTTPSGLLLYINSSGLGNEIQVTYGQDENTTITILNSNLYNYHVIDGLDGRVLRGSAASPTFENYVNNFQNTDLFQFPVLYPGENNISIEATTNDIVSLEVRYYPTFLV